MASGFYIISESNTRKIPVSANQNIYILTKPDATLVNADDAVLNTPHKPFIIDIEELGAAFIVPFNSWDSSYHYYTFTINGKDVQITAGMIPELITPVLILDVTTSGGGGGGGDA